MELAGVHGPATTIAGVTLSIGVDGFAVDAPWGPPVTVAWSDVGSTSCGEGGILADGTPAVAIGATVAGRLIRWLVPEEQMPPGRAVAIDHLLATRAGSASLPEAGPPTGRTTGGAAGSAATFGPSPVDRRRPSGSSDRSGRVPLLAPPGGAHRGTTSVSRRRPLGVMVAWMAIVALVLVGAGLLVAASITAHHRPPTGARGGARAGASKGLAEARTMARAVTLRLADLPKGWTTVSTRSGPLSGFLRRGAEGASSSLPSPATASRYARCLGVRTAAVPFVSLGPAPLAQSESEAFAGPATGAPMQVASITSVYATRSPVRRAVSQLRRHGFAACFGAAVGAEFARSVAAQAPSGVTTGTASSQALALPRWAGIRATGVALKLPLDVRGDATSVQLGFVFVTGARVEATLVSFSTTGVPSGVSQSLAATLEEEVAAAGGA